MKSSRKIIFWILLFMLSCLVCCATILAGYVVWGPSLLNRSIIEPTPVSELSRKATISVYKLEEDQYYQQGNMEKWLETSNKEVALDPKNAYIHVYRARIFYLSAKKQRGLLQSMDLLTQSLQESDQAIAKDPTLVDAYALRAFAFEDYAAGYPYRADREHLYHLALENIKVLSNFNPVSNFHPERYQVFYEADLHQCDEAMADAFRLENTIADWDKASITNETMFERVYVCKGDYQKAYDYHQKNLSKTNTIDNNSSTVALYLYQMGKPNEAFDLINNAVKNQTQLGPLYFLRAVIEYDRNQYGDALQDADLAENNAWASGSYIAYIEGLEAVRLGHREEAISKLQYAEATFTWDYPFVIQRCRDELKKLGTEPITVTPSVNIRTTTMPKK